MNEYRVLCGEAGAGVGAVVGTGVGLSVCCSHRHGRRCIRFTGKHGSLSLLSDFRYLSDCRSPYAHPVMQLDQPLQLRDVWQGWHQLDAARRGEAGTRASARTWKLRTDRQKTKGLGSAFWVGRQH